MVYYGLLWSILVCFALLAFVSKLITPWLLDACFKSYYSHIYLKKGSNILYIYTVIYSNVQMFIWLSDLLFIYVLFLFLMLLFSFISMKSLTFNRFFFILSMIFIFLYLKSNQLNHYIIILSYLYYDSFIYSFIWFWILYTPLTLISFSFLSLSLFLF